jgi:hypothetical protein
MLRLFLREILVEMILVTLLSELFLSRVATLKQLN